MVLKIVMCVFSVSRIRNFRLTVNLSEVSQIVIIQKNYIYGLTLTLKNLMFYAKSLKHENSRTVCQLKSSKRGLRNHRQDVKLQFCFF